MPRSTHAAIDEWPLVVFTTLAIMGAGLLTTPFIAWTSGQPVAAVQPVLWWAPFLIVGGVLVSQAHLGQPWRASLAARGLGTSRLSAEIVVLVLLVGPAMLLVARPHSSEILPPLSAALALVFLLTLGAVYALRGQEAWRGAVAFTPLTLGLGFGALALSATWDGAILTVGSVAAVILAADTALVIVRRFALMYPKRPMAPAYPPLFARRHQLLTARVVLADLLPGLFVFASLPALATTSLALGLLVDRVAFYGLAAQHTTEAEIAAVEGEM